MKLIDGINLKGRPFEIPDCSRDDLPQFFVDMGYKVGAEIGVYKGEFSEKICQAGLKLYAVDPWRSYKGYQLSKSQNRQDFLYDHAQRALAPYIKNRFCILVRKSSMESLEDFEDESLDFVYIDGNHDFRYIAEDICEWTKKVKKGGIVSGHDYTLESEAPNPYVLHVKYVVDAFTKAFSIQNWYLLGRTEILPGEKREISRSWMFVKK